MNLFSCIILGRKRTEEQKTMYLEVNFQTDTALYWLGAETEVRTTSRTGKLSTKFFAGKAPRSAIYCHFPTTRRVKVSWQKALLNSTTCWSIFHRIPQLSRTLEYRNFTIGFHYVNTIFIISVHDRIDVSFPLDFRDFRSRENWRFISITCLGWKHSHWIYSLSHVLTIRSIYKMTELSPHHLHSTISRHERRQWRMTKNNTDPFESLSQHTFVAPRCTFLRTARSSLRFWKYKKIPAARGNEHCEFTIYILAYSSPQTFLHSQIRKWVTSKTRLRLSTILSWISLTLLSQYW